MANDEHAGKPGKPGEPGDDRHGGAGGVGGVGGRGGRTGGAGGRGGRGGHVGSDGDLSKHTRRSQIIAALITLVIVSLGYAVLFTMRDDNLAQCERRNMQIEAINRNIDALAVIAHEERRRHLREHEPRHKFPHPIEIVETERVKPTDCDAVIHEPWPFG
jgi:hypothetical protein